jgi:proline iminopeptidase
LIFHNRLDMNCPVQNAWDLHKALPKSKLCIIPARGHSSKLMFDTMKKMLKERL